MHTKYLLVPFSYIFHPIFVSLYGTLLYFTFEGNLVSDIHMYFTFFQILLLTVILPLCFCLLLRTLNLVSSFTEATLEERKIPIFIQMALMYVLLRYGGLQESEPVLSHFSSVFSKIYFNLSNFTETSSLPKSSSRIKRFLSNTLFIFIQI